IGREVLQRIERDIMLQVVDSQWKDHLYSLDRLKEGIGLRGYGQRDPLIEYKKESFDLFQAMKERIDQEIIRFLWWLRPVINEEAPQPRRPARRATPLTLNNPSESSASASVFGGGRAAAAVQEGPFAPPRQQQPARTGGDDAAVKTV